MESRIAAAIAQATEPEFNAVQFEKKLMQLKDSQESINSLSAWCLEHRIHHKKIVIAWLSVLKKVKIEQRLTLFYLANDVIQYSKRKNYDFVESWGTTLQKATTLVREEKVKARILRIFKIWEQRGVYGEEFIADLSGLISASPIGQKLNQDPQDFQPAYLINRIRGCAKLESDTDLKLRILKDTNPKITDSETLCASLKDRQHVEDVEKEVESGIVVIESYVNALKAEIKSRTHLISCLSQADTYYTTERKEVKVVVNAYKNFTTRVKNLQKKLDELIPTLNSPVPSPDINAPSPEPDSDSETQTENEKLKCQLAAGVNIYAPTENYNANYYTPTTQASTQSDEFANNGFSSFMGSGVMGFNLQNFNRNIFSSEQPCAPVETSLSVVYDPTSQVLPQSNLTYNPNAAPQPVAYPSNPQPLLPPPMPPFTSSYMDTNTYTDTTYAEASDSYANNSNYEPIMSTAPYAVSSEVQRPYNSGPDAYNPEEDIETWDPETVWDISGDLETPESPPNFEKEGFSDPIEYDDSKSAMSGIIGGKDVDHRVLLPTPDCITDTDLRGSRSGAKDVDHRNLISLTGSPRSDTPTSMLEPPPAPPPLWSNQDQDYRAQDQDYRVAPPVIMDMAIQLKLPPPPPPPLKQSSPIKKAVGNDDNVESIDMDLSDDESGGIQIHSVQIFKKGDTIDTSMVRSNPAARILQPPPEPPHLPPHLPLLPLPQPRENGALRREFPPPPAPNTDAIIAQLDSMNPVWTGGDEWGGPLAFGAPPPFAGPPKMDFRAFRGRGVIGEMFRGRGGRARGGGRNRLFRGNRGNFNNRGPRGPFRGKFRGGF